MRFVDLGPRFNAALIDCLVLVAVSLLYSWLQYFSWGASVAIAVPSALVYPAYKVWFHAHGGRSLGKMAVRIHVEMVDGSPIGWRAATLRYLPLIFYGVLTGLAALATILGIAPDALTSATWVERGHLIRAAKPAWQSLFYWLWMLWLFAEASALRTSKSRRAIHDFIAGTVVVHDTKTSGAIDK